MLYGTVVGAGGADRTRHIHIKPLHKETAQPYLVCRADEELVKAVAARMFEVVHLAGVATWDPVTRQITDFEAEELLPYRATGTSAAVQRLREAAGGDLDGQDPLAVRRAVRGYDSAEPLP